MIILTIMPLNCLRIWPFLHNREQLHAQAKNIDVVIAHFQAEQKSARLCQALAASLAALLILCGSVNAAPSPDIHYYTNANGRARSFRTEDRP